MLKYRGGKARELSEITPFIPNEFERYIEPFFGGGALYFHLEPKKSIINDLNGSLMKFYSGVKDDYDNLEIELREIEARYEHNRLAYEKKKAKNPEKRIYDANEDFYYIMREMFNEKTDKVYSDAAIYYFINKTAYSGMIRYNKNGEFNVPYGRYKRVGSHLVTHQHSTLLNTATIENLDYQKIFDRCSSNDFVFLDPPYDCVFSDYGNKETSSGFNENEHRRLCSSFRELPCKALMVIGKTELTRSLYEGHIVHEYGKKYSVNIRNRFRAASQHILVANYKKD